MRHRESMNGHFHTGIVSFVFAGLAAIVMIQLLRIVSAQLLTNTATEGAGKIVGALVTFK
jgi:hypothetical protein